MNADDTGSNPALADTDGDGFDDGLELASSSNPTNPASQPRFSGTVGIGAGHPAGSVDSAGSRMNIENAPETFPTLAAGTYEVTAFTYAAGSDPADLQPFLAANTGGDNYVVLWAGPAAPASGSNAVTVVSYQPGTQQFMLTSATPVHAGFNAAGPNVRFGAGLTDHNNPADFTLVPESTITSWTNPNLGRSYAFEINVVSADPARDELQIDVKTSGVNPDDLELTWQSKSGKLYNLRSQTDPAAGEPATWPVWGGHENLAATPPGNTLIIPRPADSFRLFVIEEFNAPPVSVLFDDFESGQGDWTAGSEGEPGTLWELGVPSTVGPLAAPSPDHCFGTNLSGNYATDAEIWLRSPPVDLTNAGAATLRFAQFRDIEAGFDFGTVRVLDAADNSELGKVADLIDDVSFEWEPISAALPAEALGRPVLIEFRFFSDLIGNFAGWYIDDVEVTVP